MKYNSREENVRAYAKISSLLRTYIAGICFTMMIALFGYGLGKVPVFNYVGQMAWAIIIAVVYRQILGYPEKLRAGIQFSSKRLLRMAIILFGLKLNIDVVFHQGLILLIRDVGTVFFSIIITMLLAKWLKADLHLSILLGIGTGVCGAAAIAAVSPILKAKEEDTALGAGIIALVGTIFAIMYTVLRPFLPITSLQYGIWSGISLHEIAHVALAASPGGHDALTISLLAKLGRVFLLIPLSFLLLYWMKRKGKRQHNTKIEFPWFLIGFLAMSFFGSFIVGKYLILPKNIINDISTITTYMLTMAMVGLGLNIHLKDLRTKALRPLLAMVIASLLLSLLSYFSLKL
ncbi:YeiH family protein [Heyndrickxia ginsengihumi]|uniref:Putative sulfate exporter family transporter n=1 Tax=Heyndrickxia ginsengihumi TaxID=363870 RepID=A0A6M0P801_9BACI|nr:putative sulfate exporter family transporter [Heyndrickxia ginsengihumi]MBE6184637.1 putative sulfate exporter family transporter [Bacillus sp. (in: firmicutes)]MCM3024257.1 putative sulfate exporter family transporter [Heyndrickxia ginsengihumi]NEY20613.1 putative sulfate exporter family transporter [Heyndrickxia ginsengihumi]